MTNKELKQINNPLTETQKSYIKLLLHSYKTAKIQLEAAHTTFRLLKQFGEGVDVIEIYEKVYGELKQLEPINE